ncbi:MAG: hypothetical protein ACI8UR_000491 [Natronomonas sp.]|jgi:uncharacterized protein (DUF1684 family)|uniref:DUF1684 domain-containing protein n=1 Tax=Natronomonas sp. TaxID=2184060 RepID=UPI00398A0814
MDFDVDAWREELESYRAQKDEQFANARASPLPPEERDGFDGLDYFAPNPDFRVAATIELVDSDETVTMETTVDGEQLYERAARLRFELEDASGETAEHTLVAYQRIDYEGGVASDASDPSTDADASVGESLFVPFRDKTTGQQTYSAGRYMELHTEGASQSDANSSSGEGTEPRDGQLNDGATVPLDFNLAYSPFCAYSDAYECPLPPRENWLEVAVPAGERF